MKRTWIQRICSIGLVLVLSLSFLALAGRILERKTSVQKNGEFLEEARLGHVDALFLGSSHVVNGINPVQLYEEHGITSFNLGGHGSILPVSYWTLVNALDYCTPRYVFIDTFMIEEDYHVLDVMNGWQTDAAMENAVGQLHEVLDFLPLTRNKLRALQDLIADPVTKASFVFDLIAYHDRWQTLTEEDYHPHRFANGLFGCELRYDVDSAIQEFELIPPEERMEEETEGVRYLRRMIELLQERGIAPILIQVPYAEHPDYQRAANAGYILAEEYDVPYVNMAYVPELINAHADLSSQTHLSAIGARKVTEYMGEVLSTLALPDHRGEPGYEKWNQRVLDWHEQILDEAIWPKDLHAALMMLQFPDISSIVFINRNSNAFYDEQLRRLVIDLAGTQGIRAVDPQHRSYCLVRDSAQGRALETVGSEPIEDMETSFGLVNFRSPEENYNFLAIGEEQGVNALDYQNNYAVDVQIFLFDRRDGSQIAHLYFDDSVIQMLPERNWSNR